MSEIKTEIKENNDGSYTVTDAHSTADIVRWLLTQDDKETILRLLEAPQPRTWVGLTDEQIDGLHNKIKVQLMGTFNIKDIYRVIEAELRSNNT